MPPPKTFFLFGYRIESHLHNLESSVNYCSCFSHPPSAQTSLQQFILLFRVLCWLSGKQSSANAGDVGSIPGSGKSPGEGNGNPFQYSCLGNPRDRGAWPATVHAVTKESDTTEGLNNNNSNILLFSFPISVAKLSPGNLITNNLSFI